MRSDLVWIEIEKKKNEAQNHEEGESLQIFFNKGRNFYLQLREDDLPPNVKKNWENTRIDKNNRVTGDKTDCNE